MTCQLPQNNNIMTLGHRVRIYALDAQNNITWPTIRIYRLYNNIL